MSDTKGEQEFLDALRSAWEAGWHAGGARVLNYDKKKADCSEIMAQYPAQVAAKDLLRGLELIAEECFDAMEGTGLPEFQFYEHWMNIAKNRIAKAQSKQSVEVGQ